MNIQVIQPAKLVSQRKLRVAGYIRVSTDSENQEDSLDNQKITITAFIKSNPDWEFVDIYADQGISGYMESRPRFQEMLEDARNGKIDLIIVKSISRFARNTETMLKATRELKRIGVGIVFQLQNINTLSAEGELMLTILAAFAQGESEGASANAKLTIRRKFERGVPMAWADRTYGYRKLENGNVIIQEDEAKIVRLIFTLALQGVWVSKIRKKLNDMGIMAPQSKKWDNTAVVRILHNVSYKGDLILQKTFLDAYRHRHPNEGQENQYYITEDHPAIIDTIQWDQVQEILEARSLEFAAKSPIKPHSSNSLNQYPLTGKLFCPRCGSSLIHRWANGGRSEYWACSKNLKKGSKTCRGIWLPAETATGWGEINEPVTVMLETDSNGMPFYTTYLKSEFDQIQSGNKGEGETS